MIDAYILVAMTIATINFIKSIPACISPGKGKNGSTVAVSGLVSFIVVGKKKSFLPSTLIPEWKRKFFIFARYCKYGKVFSFLFINLLHILTNVVVKKYIMCVIKCTFITQ